MKHEEVIKRLNTINEIPDPIIPHALAKDDDIPARSLICYVKAQLFSSQSLKRQKTIRAAISTEEFKRVCNFNDIKTLKKYLRPLIETRWIEIESFGRQMAKIFHIHYQPYKTQTQFDGERITYD